MKRKFDLKFKFTLLVLFVFMIILGASEYRIILERFVKIICSSCIGLS